MTLVSIIKWKTLAQGEKVHSQVVILTAVLTTSMREQGFLVNGPRLEVSTAKTVGAWVLVLVWDSHSSVDAWMKNSIISQIFPLVQEFQGDQEVQVDQLDQVVQGQWDMVQLPMALDQILTLTDVTA
ncbi:uncharacterized protein LOC143284790 [Babylonia areolata]|uniref:uncharacterized protein LOC143284790 n=1 Tax=Babylonia areolata TaxID=304850 RepID=UPI003FCFA74F